MLFPTHLLVGYVVGRRWDLPWYWVVAGAALPDVLDKPLASADVFELHQTVGHSLVAFVVAGVVVLVGRSDLAGRRDFDRGSGILRRLGSATGNSLAGRSGVAFLVGWASHLLLDVVHMVVNGRPDDVRFLAWPFVQHVPAVNLPPVEFAFHYLWTPSFVLEVAIWLGVGLVVLNERVVGTRTP